MGCDSVGLLQSFFKDLYKRWDSFSKKSGLKEEGPLETYPKLKNHSE